MKDGRRMLRLRSTQETDAPATTSTGDESNKLDKWHGISLSAYILCGGSSARMGEEKGLVEFQGKTFVQRILEAVNPLVPNPVLVTGNPAYRVFGLEAIPDLVVAKGPVGGILTALSHSSADQVLVLSCDIPKITSEVLGFLVEKASLHPDLVTFLTDGQNNYPLIAVYPKSLVEDFRKAVSEDRLKLRQLVESLPHHRLEVAPTNADFLRNINTKTELNTLSNPY